MPLKSLKSENTLGTSFIFFYKKKWKTFFVSRWIIHFIPGIFFEIRSPSLRKSRLKVCQISLLSQLLTVPHNPCIPDAKSAVFIEKSFILGKLHVGMLKYEKEVFLMKLSTDMMFSRKIRNFSKTVVFGCCKVTSDFKHRMLEQGIFCTQKT